VTQAIVVRGARQNNLRNLDLDIPLGELIVVTGVSGSGKSSLVMDTLYAEGQRRYVETFSPYARQFLDRMDKPQVDRIEGVPPAIAIDQLNPVRTSRSTVGTMTEINDHLKLLFARAATLHCRQCLRPVRRDSAESIVNGLPAQLAALGADARLLVCFPVPVPKKMPLTTLRAELEKQGYTRIHQETKQALTVIQDRLRYRADDRSRLAEALEAAARAGHGRLSLHAVDEQGAELAAWRYSTELHCAECDLQYQEATPGLFSFNSAIGACETCKGFGRIIGIDYGLVIPDESKSLAAGAIKPWQTPSFKECQDDLLKYAKARGIPRDRPWRELTAAQRAWVIDGEGDWNRKIWYGAKRYFSWLESKAYKMHIRVLLSRYRSYTQCPGCRGARLKPDALLWRVGASHTHSGGRNLHELTMLSLQECRDFFARLNVTVGQNTAQDLVLHEIRARLNYLCEVGLGYLTLDRQSRTLSGGEVQRINLTTALGTSLVNTLFVLDEPSIGLHARDMERIVGVMKRLRDAGNSLLVVEHDAQIMLAADRLLELGPGAGEHGGALVANSTPAQLCANDTSLTGAWLSGRRTMPVLRAARQAAAVVAGTPAAAIRLEGASQHNLKNLDVTIPLHQLVCLTGVSGSGKSTLIQDVLYPAILKAQGKSTEAPGALRALGGVELIESVVMIDQTPIGRTTRSNPASHVGAFDEIRALFAATPDATLRRYTAGTFSFNSGNGRCPVCSGNGFEHVEMQFLSDVYLRCGECEGRRFRAEVQEIRLSGATGAQASISEVLEMTVTTALQFFALAPKVLARLRPLSDVGLDYLRLGQPVPTLSGGEAQRLKIAGYLAEAALVARTRKGAAADTRGKLLLFDEPTTGLHFEDIARLMGALGLLLETGHSLLVIEHNLDVIGAADWIIELGPEGGNAGGQLVCSGTPQQVAAHATSHTGRALADYQRLREQRRLRPAATMVAEPAVRAPPEAAVIAIRGAREHNLRNIDVDIPRGAFTVVTGVSGSGKSTLAFDILFNEGQRRYLESLNAYARQFVQPASRADIDSIRGIPPTVAIEQRASRGGQKSTVATLTEIYHFLRLLYVRLGVQHCPDCRVAIAPLSSDAIAARLLRSQRGRRLQLLAPLIAQRKGIYTDLARWAAARGATRLRVDGVMVPTSPFPKLKRFVEHTIELPVATLSVSARAEAELRRGLDATLQAGRGVAHVLDDAGEVQVFSSRRACPRCQRGFAEPSPRLLSFNSAQGWCTTCHGTGQQLEGFDAESSGEEAQWLEAAPSHNCSDCGGERLNAVARALHFQSLSITALTRRSVDELQEFFATLQLDERGTSIARDALSEIAGRLRFLHTVGLGYLSLDRAAPTLSGGEAQRIRLAAQLGSSLQGVCYVLDEPTIGLHPRDNLRLLGALQLLASGRNTLVVVEHDEDTIRRADHIIDLGPGAGVRGGAVTASGTAAQLCANPASITGQFLNSPLPHAATARRAVTRATASLRLTGIELHNLHQLNVRIPLGRLVVITGVSGSGKSTLSRDVLYANLHTQLAQRRGAAPALNGMKALRGGEQVDRVLEVDQTPIGRTPRSCPATYVGFYDDIRKLYAGSSEAQLRGYSASRFSFNTGGGRCTECEGQGQRTVEMSFLPNVRVLCERCGGARFDRETRDVRWRDRSISDILAMNVDSAVEFFSAHPRIRRPLALLQDVGLGYLTLGQPSPTLSGGEAQRIKLVTELARMATPALLRQKAPHSLYVLDEPTVGLHMADVAKLTEVLHRLVDTGNSVVMVEHNLDVMAEADWIIDLGPEAGAAGGRVVVEGPPAIIADCGHSHTGTALRSFLDSRTGEQSGRSRAVSAG
jgi:excinuclease ABC subunit A